MPPDSGEVPKGFRQQREVLPAAATSPGSLPTPGYCSLGSTHRDSGPVAPTLGKHLCARETQLDAVSARCAAVTALHMAITPQPALQAEGRYCREPWPHCIPVCCKL